VVAENVRLKKRHSTREASAVVFLDVKRVVRPPLEPLVGAVRALDAEREKVRGQDGGLPIVEQVDFLDSEAVFVHHAEPRVVGAEGKLRGVESELALKGLEECGEGCRFLRWHVLTPNDARNSARP